MLEKRKIFIDTLTSHRNYLVRTETGKCAFTVDRIISDFDEYDLWNWIDRIDVDVVNYTMRIRWCKE